MWDYMKYSQHKFHHPTPNRPDNNPHQLIATNDGYTSPPLVHTTDEYPELNTAEANNV